MTGTLKQTDMPSRGAKGLIIGHYPTSASTRNYLLLALTVLVLFAGITRASAQEIPVWVYHNFPPYIIDIEREEGISFDLVRHLNASADGKYQFHLEVLPRMRLDYRLESDVPGIVLWVNPAWFGDRDKTRFLWTDPILTDSNVVISPRDVAFRYTGPESLAGMALVGLRGHKYPGVDQLVADGRIDRFDVNAESHLMQFIATGRGDVAIIANSAARYHVKRDGLEDAIFFSRTPHSTYSRNILVHPQLTGLYDFLQAVLKQLTTSKEWTATLRSYGVDNNPLN